MPYRVDGWKGIAFYKIGPEVEWDYEGEQVETGRIEVCMVGDDRVFAVDPEDIHKLDETDYCHVCGQIGCTHDGLVRD